MSVHSELHTYYMYTVCTVINIQDVQYTVFSCPRNLSTVCTACISRSFAHIHYLCIHIFLLSIYSLSMCNVCIRRGTHWGDNPMKHITWSLKHWNMRFMQHLRNMEQCSSGVLKGDLSGKLPTWLKCKGWQKNLKGNSKTYELSLLTERLVHLVNFISIHGCFK